MTRATIIPQFFTLVFSMFLFSSCEKEYSYEQGQQVIPVIPVPADTTRPVVPEFNNCDLCNPLEEPAVGQWSFKTGPSFLCGAVDTAIINFERTAFTFFGPSACAGDSGLIFTVYLSPYVLDRDTYNLTVPYASFYYYRTGFPNLLANRTDQSFTFTISSYNHTSRVAKGVFNGTAYRPDGSPAVVHSGRFAIELR